MTPWSKPPQAPDYSVRNQVYLVEGCCIRTGNKSRSAPETPQPKFFGLCGSQENKNQNKLLFIKWLNEKPLRYSTACCA